ncbi:MAG: 50S ribosomal protein L34 [bacterium]
MSKTYQPKKRKRAKTHGFLVRSKTKYGKNTLKRRRRIGRKILAVQPSKKRESK